MRVRGAPGEDRFEIACVFCCPICSPGFTRDNGELEFSMFYGRWWISIPYELYYSHRWMRCSRPLVDAKTMSTYPLSHFVCHASNLNSSRLYPPTFLVTGKLPGQSLGSLAHRMTSPPRKPSGSGCIGGLPLTRPLTGNGVQP